MSKLLDSQHMRQAREYLNRADKSCFIISKGEQVPRTHLNMPPCGLRWRVTSSKLRPFLATKSASFSAVLFSSGSGSSAAAGCIALGGALDGVSESSTYKAVSIQRLACNLQSVPCDYKDRFYLPLTTRSKPTLSPEQQQREASMSKISSLTMWQQFRQE